MTSLSLAAAHGGPLRHLPVALAAALVPVLVLVLGLDVFCLVNLVRAKSVRNAPKLVWAIVILAVSAPLGALLYLFFGMDRGGVAASVAVRAPAPPAAPVSAAGRTAAGTPLIVTTSGLTKDYGGNGLFSVDLAVPLGSVYGLVGLNGAGKTTLLSILSATRRPTAGSVSVAADRRRVAVCPDVPAFDGWLTAREVVDLACALVAPELGDAAVTAALRTAGLTDAADRRVGAFSRGMVQRLGLACALVSDPELLILDEPTSALDPAGRADILDLVAGLRGQRTVIFSSHILADVQRVADHVGILRDGRLLYQGAAMDLIDTYLSPRWLIRIAGDAEPVAAAMAAAGWATSVVAAGPDVIRVDAVSMEAGERGIPAVIAACGARQVSCEPAAADLESAFLAITGSATTGSATTGTATTGTGTTGTGQERP
ncbi:MAG TPA: ATP-binding cassette domain-containing protein [Streptosporangiaceae bacterium]